MSLAAKLAMLALFMAGLFVSGYGMGTKRANAKHELARLQDVEKARQIEANWQDDAKVVEDEHENELQRIARERDRARAARLGE